MDGVSTIGIYYKKLFNHNCIWRSGYLLQLYAAVLAAGSRYLYVRRELSVEIVAEYGLTGSLYFVRTSDVAVMGSLMEGSGVIFSFL